MSKSKLKLKLPLAELDVCKKVKKKRDQVDYMT